MFMLTGKNTNDGATASIIIAIADIGGGLLLPIVGADDSNVVTDNLKALAITAHLRTSGGGHTLDEAVGGVLEVPRMRFLRRHVARPHGHERTHGDGRAGSDVDPLGHRRAVVVEHEVARRGERGHG